MDLNNVPVFIALKLKIIQCHFLKLTSIAHAYAVTLANDMHILIPHGRLSRERHIRKLLH